MKRQTGQPFLTPLWLVYGALSASGIAVYMLGYHTPRTDFFPLLLWFALAFLAYFLLVKSPLTLGQGLVWALFLRLVLLFATPAFSDDYFRFLWDGHLLQNGLNPYLSLPSAWMASGQPLPTGFTPELYNGLNSANYYSVYPPVCQAIFWLSTKWASSTFGSLIVMRVCLLLAEAGTLWLLPRLLQKLGIPARQALWYALNPAIILELTGNLHFEVLLIFFLVGALYLLAAGQWQMAAVLFGLSVGSKLLPLVLLPLVPRLLGWRRAFGFWLLVALVLGLLFLPFLSRELFLHFSSSLQLYFQKFEFNASIYYLLRALGSWVAGFNLIAFIGPALSFFTLLAALWLSMVFRREEKDMAWFLRCSLALFTVYLLLATTVHPWYLSTVVVLATFTRFRYPMVWSGVAVLSYAAYQNAYFQENLWLVAVEYAVVLAYLVWEISYPIRDSTSRTSTAWYPSIIKK